MLARLIPPGVIASVDLDLIRSRTGVPQPIPSRITNLRVLEVIYEFGRATVIHLGVSPQTGDASDPGSATQVHLLNAEASRDPDFGGEE